MEENQTPAPQSAELAQAGPYCPICGDNMHITELLGVQYRECNDPTCGFIEPV